MQDDAVSTVAIGGTPVIAGMLDWFFQGLGDTIPSLEPGEKVNNNP